MEMRVLTDVIKMARWWLHVETKNMSNVCVALFAAAMVVTTSGFPLTINGLGNGTVAGSGRAAPLAGMETMGLAIPQANKVYVVRAPPLAWRPEVFWNLPLLGRKISFGVILSRHGCGCVASVYLVGMPAVGGDQAPMPGPNGDYYCDANKANGEWCPEIDIMEANARAFYVAPHGCVRNGLDFTSCDTAGCAQRIDSTGNVYGPGAQYKINTHLPFTVNAEFVADGTTLVDIVVTVVQLQSTGITSIVSMEFAAQCGSEYIAGLSQSVAAGMTLVISNWAGRSTEWLDGQSCGARTAATCVGDPKLPVWGFSIEPPVDASTEACQLPALADVSDTVADYSQCGGSSSTSIGTVCAPTCREGLLPVIGSCGPEGLWEPQEPHCSQVSYVTHKDTSYADDSDTSGNMYYIWADSIDYCVAACIYSYSAGCRAATFVEEKSRCNLMSTTRDFKAPGVTGITFSW